MDREIELKLEGEPEALERVRRARALARLKKGRSSPRKLRSVYFDTDDFALMKGGLTLRVREADGQYVQTLKSESGGSGPASDRGEWEASLGRSASGPDLNRLPDGLRKKIQTLANGAAISPRLVTDIHRTASNLETPEGDEIELAIDHGVLRANGQEARISELELELKRGSAASLYRLALKLADIAPLRVGLHSKAERGFALAHDAAPRSVRAEAIEIARHANIEEAYSAILRHCLHHLLMNDAAAFDAHLPEGLHQMRVALRRMRSAFSVFGRIMGGDTARYLSAEARWLAGAIGQARDLDVFVSDTLSAVEAGTPGDEELARLREAAGRMRDKAWDEARQAARSARMTRFVLRLALYIAECGWRSESGAERQEDGKGFEAPAASFASRALDRRLRKVVKLGRQIEHLKVAERHELRKRLKKLRYTLGFFSSLYRRSDVRRYQQHLSQLQDVFGSLNDAAAAQELLTALVEADPGLAAPAARVIAFQERRAERDWRTALRHWRDFRGEMSFWE